MAGRDKVEPRVSGEEVRIAFFAVEFAEARMALVVQERQVAQLLALDECAALVSAAIAGAQMEAQRETGMLFHSTMALTDAIVYAPLDVAVLRSLSST